MSTRETFDIPGQGKLTLQGYRWRCQGKPRALVVISHGMAETALRYEAFADFLTKQAISVYAHDHRGHGQGAAARNELGWFGPDGFNALVADLSTAVARAIEEEPGVPVFLFAHSMGSFAAQLYACQSSKELSGLILSGSNGPPPAAVHAGILIAKIQSFFCGARKPGVLLDTLAFGTYNQKFEKRTKFDWLSSDTNQVDAYIADPLCGNIHSIGFFLQFSQALLAIWEPGRLKQVRANLPILLFSGALDPVGLYGQGVRALRTGLMNAGLSDVSLELCEGGRHEMLNEQKREDVFAKLLAWINTKL